MEFNKKESLIAQITTRFKTIKGHNNDDAIDRLSHVYTSVSLVIIAIFLTTAHFVGKPIHCWNPAHYDKDWYKGYIENYCWISNTYHVAFHEQLPEGIEERTDREITYYQWVPLILLFQAFLFKIPNIIWRLLHSHAGVSLHNMVDLAEKTQGTSPKDRQDTIQTLADIIDHWLKTERSWKDNRYTRMRDAMSQKCSLMCSKRGGNFLAGLYVIVKLLFFANVVAQFFILNAFMASNYNMYGFEVLHKLSDNTPWDNSPRFPLVTFCDFQIRQLQNIVRYSLQCVLPINLFNEKFFIFLWFWFFIMGIASLYSLVKTLVVVVDNGSRYQFVKKYLKIDNKIQSGLDRKVCRRFADQYLREDGVFVLRVITSNSTDLVTTDLVSELWRKFNTEEEKASANQSSNGLRDDFTDIKANN
ncbi:UNC9-like protein [Mya arenaria]|uniref:Innexin n=1 Tax=Mya arenaria TaxID=6604 RepID=A0ABY7FPL8_MYAAR|nr:UNC9-like protein [Mya arenaria]